MRREAIAAEVQYFLLDFDPFVGGARFSLKNYVGSDQRTGYGACPWANEHHPNAGVLMDHCFHFFGMNLKASDVDGSIPPPDEIVAFPTQLHHVSRIDVAVGVSDTLGLLSDIADRISS